MDVIVGIAVASAPGVLVAMLGLLFAYLRDRRLAREALRARRSVLLANAAAAVAELAEVVLNPHRNPERLGVVGVRARFALSDLEAELPDSGRRIGVWLERVISEIEAGNPAWTDPKAVRLGVLRPLLMWQQGWIESNWFPAPQLDGPAFLPRYLSNELTVIR